MQFLPLLRQVAGVQKQSRFATGVLPRKYSFLGGYGTLLVTRSVRIGQVRRFLVRLIIHFSGAAGIHSISQDQFGVEPYILIRVDLSARNFFHFDVLDPLVSDPLEMVEGAF